MATSEKALNGIQFGKYKDSEELGNAIRKYVKKTIDDVVFLCIGTDRSTGDSYAPLIGTYLMDRGYTNVFGCIDDPVHGMNLEERINEIPDGKTIIAIDAALGRQSSIGKISFRKGKLSPGAGLNKKLLKVGDFNIIGVVNVSGFKEFLVLQNTRLSLVMKMANETANALESAFPIEKEINLYNVKYKLDI